MSLRILVIPEDPTYNGYILKPVVEMLLAEVGKPTARISVLSKPRLRGYDQAVDAVRNDLVSLYRHMDVWLFLPDGDRATPTAMSDLESHLASQDVTLLCCPAVPEVEIYACVAYQKEVPMAWAKVRSHARLKEEVFEPLLKVHGNPRSPGGGREKMTLESVSRRDRFFQRCPEMARLRDRIRAVIG